MKIITVDKIDKIASKLIPIPSKTNKKNIESILLDVKKNGDNAVKKYEKRFGGLKNGSLRVSKKEIQSSYLKVSKDQINAIIMAKKTLSKTEKAIKKRLGNFDINTQGVKIKKFFLPISSVGCYVPGGSARYPSSLVMSVIPAKIAGVKRIVVTTPSNKQGLVDPLTIVAADLCGVKEIYKIGGAQAIAALSFGTKSIPPVDKIVGPGSSFVSIAKYLISERTSIDMIAGPTELGIIVDSSAKTDLVAADLISQAEHSNDTFCFVLTKSKKLANNIKLAVKQKIKNIKRKEIVQKSLEKNGFIAICKTEKDMITLANKLAPEHLEIITKKPKALATKITTAGLVLLGENTP
ncbi:MAG: histidinol dehydrogenase, partial [Nitrosopumilaceae archaeon]